jgi:MFS family permease
LLISHSIGVGSVIGQFVATYYGNKTVAKHIALDDFKPEHRLYIMAIGGFFMPVGFLIYGWTVQSHTHFMAPLIGTGFVGFSFLIIFMSAASYLVDVFTTHAASAMAASTVSRSLFAALVPLSGQQMYAKLGYGWGNTLLASIACLLIPIPFVLIKYGEQIRTRSTVKL